ncbi:MAG: hypothetical protein M3Y49_13640 [Actinomycetota bacterium]|nr:hypothetical protein [Actinomycetota bacterium]
MTATDLLGWTRTVATHPSTAADQRSMTGTASWRPPLYRPGTPEHVASGKLGGWWEIQKAMLSINRPVFSARGPSS